MAGDRRVIRGEASTIESMTGQRMSVPDLVGFGWDEARDMARAVGLSPRAVGPDGQKVNGKGGVVIDQAPSPGSKVARGTDVSLRIAFGGGHAGDREPRHPIPHPREFTQWNDPGLGPMPPGGSQSRQEREPELVGG